MIRVLGIDPGTAIVGWGIIDCSNGSAKTNVIAYGHIETDKTLSTSERLAEISDNLLLVLQKYEPHEAAIEELFYFKNAKTVISVAQARGVIINTCFQNKLTIAEYTPLQIKQSLTGYGRAEKKQVQKMIQSVLNLKSIPKPDDTADALATALCHINSRRYLHTIS